MTAPTGQLPDPAFWDGASVFLTGHTGFKGSWLTLWLHSMGARVHGYSLAPNTTPNLFTLLDLPSLCASNTIADIRDDSALAAALLAAKPSLVIHAAAQPLVRESYAAPIETFDVNIMGTARLLEACRRIPTLRAILIITTDKVYENRESVHPYRETDPLGGRDPYSASKAGAELITHAYAQSFFTPAGIRIATARAGNIIGGGDWSTDRLIPDAVRALSSGQPVLIRSPNSVRPWQHVLDPLCGYLLLAQALTTRPTAPSYNFGPASGEIHTVANVMDAFCNDWGTGARWHTPAPPTSAASPSAPPSAPPPVPPSAPHEAGLLLLDASLAARDLHWRPRWDFPAAIAHTARWYRAQAAANSAPTSDSLRALTRQQLAAFCHTP